MALVLAPLALAAVYSGGLWLLTFVRVLTGRIAATAEVEQHTFHLGLCFILSAGFIGLILAVGA